MCKIKPFKATTIYKITGGFQAARQAVQHGLPVEIEAVKNSDWPIQSRSHGQMSHTNTAWSVDLYSLKEECKEWCKNYGEVRFIEKTQSTS
jgi:hypothetical protein